MAVEEEARIYVNFIAKGTTETGKALGDVGRRATEAGVAAKGFQERLQTLGTTGSRAIGLLTGPLGFGMLGGSLAAFVRSGMAGTVEAERLALALGRIRLAGASAFAPWIRDVVNWVERLSISLRDMTGETQESIRQWVKFGATMSTALLLLPRVTAATTALAAAALAAGKGAAVGAGAQMVTRLAGGPGAQAAAATGAKAIGLGATTGAAAVPWGAVAVGVIGLMSASKEGRQALQSMMEAIQPLIDTVGKLAAVFSEVLAPVIIRLSKAIAWVIERIPFAGGDQPAAIRAGNEAAIRKALEEGGIRVQGQFIKNTAEVEASLKEKLAEIEARGSKARDELALQGGGMEDPKAIYARLAAAATKQAGPAEKTEKNTFDMKKSLESIKKFMEDLGGLFGKQPPDQP